MSNFLKCVLNLARIMLFDDTHSLGPIKEKHATGLGFRTGASTKTRVES